MASEERQELDAEWEKLRLAKEKFAKELADSELEEKLFVGNLAESTTEEELRAMFGPYGTIKEIVVLKDKDGTSKRSAFVKYFFKASADQATEAISGKVTDKTQDKPIVVRGAAPKPAFGAPKVGGFGGAVGGMGAAMGMGGAFGGMGVGAFGLPQQPSLYAPQQPNAYSAVPSAAPGFGRGPAGANLYVNNLNYSTTEQELTAMFSDFGQVVSTKIFQGYGFVSYAMAQSAAQAIACLNGLAVGGNKRLEVSLKKDKGAPAANRFAPY